MAPITHVLTGAGWAARTTCTRRGPYLPLPQGRSYCYSRARPRPDRGRGCGGVCCGPGRGPRGELRGLLSGPGLVVTALPGPLLAALSSRQTQSRSGEPGWRVAQWRHAAVSPRAPRRPAATQPPLPANISPRNTRPTPKEFR